MCSNVFKRTRKDHNDSQVCRERKAKAGIFCTQARGNHAILYIRIVPLENNGSNGGLRPDAALSVSQEGNRLSTRGLIQLRAVACLSESAPPQTTTGRDGSLSVPAFKTFFTGS
jgi:hypothetical protein